MLCYTCMYRISNSPTTHIQQTVSHRPSTTLQQYYESTTMLLLTNGTGCWPDRATSDGWKLNENELSLRVRRTTGQRGRIWVTPLLAPLPLTGLALSRSLSSLLRVLNSMAMATLSGSGGQLWTNNPTNTSFRLPLLSYYSFTLPASGALRNQ